MVGTRSSAAARRRAELSVVVPAYEEAVNMRPLCRRLFAAADAARLTLDLLIIDDDSGAGTLATERAVSALQKEGFAIRLIVRRRSEGRGLSSAVILGLDEALYDTLLVMDADLQHEPEAMPSVAAPILAGEAEFSVGSRNVGGGKVEDWPLSRRLISWGATALARPLAPCSDPMSGFFCLRRETYRRGARAGLNPMGYKIGLELMVRCRCASVAEVPITFRDREAGESKLTAKQQLLYLRHLAHLYCHAYPFAVVGALIAGAILAYAALRALAG